MNNIFIGLILLLFGFLFIVVSRRTAVLKYTGLSLVNLLGGLGILALSLYFATTSLQSTAAKYVLVGATILAELIYVGLIFQRHKVVVVPVITEVSSDMIQFTKWLLIVLGTILILLGLVFISVR